MKFLGKQVENPDIQEKKEVICVNQVPETVPSVSEVTMLLKPYVHLSKVKDIHK